MIFILFVLVSTIGRGQASFTFNKVTNEVCLHLDLCNECIVGIEGASVCDCRRDCAGIGDEFKEECLENAVGMIQMAQCIDQAHEMYVDCLKECGPRPTYPEIINI